MMRFLSVMGAIFIVLLVVGGAFLGYTYHIGSELDKESKEYTDTVVPKVLTGWDAAMFNEYADMQAMKEANITSAQMNEIFTWSKGKLGNITQYQGSEGRSYVNNQNGVKTTGAQYMAYAKFDHGEAKILLTLTRNGNGEWKIAGFNVNSPIFTNSPNPYR